MQPKGFHQPIPIYDVVGIGGKYDLHLPEVREEIIDLQDEIPIQFTVISGKEIIDTSYVTYAEYQLFINALEKAGEPYQPNQESTHQFPLKRLKHRFRD